MDAVLELRGVAAHSGPPLDLDLARGEAVALYAPGGAGKRWLLRVAAGLRDPGAGTVRCAARQRAYVFSSGGLVANLSVEDNLVVPLRFTGVGPDAARVLAREVLAGLGLEGVGELRPAALADEARQLVQWARAMALRADLLFLEEPFRQLSPTTGDEVCGWLRGELGIGRVTVLMSCTDRAECERVGARIVSVARVD